MSMNYLDLDTQRCEYYGNSQVPSPSSVQLVQMNMDGSLGMYGQSMFSPSTSNMSPMSQASENYMMHEPMPDTGTNPFLRIIEQPVNKFRFRYKSEMHGTHGSLTGQTTARNKKTFPSVQLHNFYDQATIRCTLYQIPRSDTGKSSPHSHSLVIRNGNVDKKDPHEKIVSPVNGYVASFQGMGIIHTARRFIQEELREKLIESFKFRNGRSPTQLEMEKFDARAKIEAADMNLNQVTLCFEAFRYQNGAWAQICAPVFSSPINNMKCALTGELKITRLSTVVSSVHGNEDLFLFVEKVGKKNIRARFYETDESEQVVWQDWGRFSEADVHHQYAIAMKTPPYMNKSIEKTVTVYIQLYRPSDDSYSEPVEFRYRPSDNIFSESRKRPRITANSSMDIPLTVDERNMGYIGQNAGCTISAEFEPQRILKQEFPNVADSTTNDFDFCSNSIQIPSGNLDSVDIEKIIPSLLDFDDNKIAEDSSSDAPRDQRSLSQTKEHGALQMLKKTLVLANRFDEANEEEKRKIKRFVDSYFKQTLTNGESIFHVALKSENDQFIDKVFEIVAKFNMNKLLDMPDDDGKTCVHVVAELGNPKLLEKLISHGVDMNAVDRKGDAPLHIAITQENPECVELLLSNGANAKILNYNGYSALHLAIEEKKLNFVEKFQTKLTSPADIFRVSESKHGNNSLHIAVESASPEIVKLILDNGLVDINATNHSNHTPLVLARAMKNTRMIRMLMDHNAANTEAEEDDDEEDDNTSCESSESKLSVDVKNLKANPVLSERNRIQTMAKIEKGKFDDICLKQLSEIFNVNNKWQTVAKAFGYNIHIPQWSKNRNPTKMMFVFSEALKLSKEDIMEKLKTLNEMEAVMVMTEWTTRNSS